MRNISTKSIGHGKGLTVLRSSKMFASREEFSPSRRFVVSPFRLWLYCSVLIGLLGVWALAMTPNLTITAAAKTNPSGLGPRIYFAEPTNDFGRVMAGEVLKREFVFTNVGDQTLILTQVRSACGCTTFTNWSRQVEPQQRGAIPFELHTSSFKGAINKTFNIMCNDTNQPTVTLNLKGSIWQPMEIIPESAGFIAVGDVVTITVKTLQIINNEQTPLRGLDKITFTFKYINSILFHVICREPIGLFEGI